MPSRCSARPVFAVTPPASSVTGRSRPLCPARDIPADRPGASCGRCPVRDARNYCVNRGLAAHSSPEARARDRPVVMDDAAHQRIMRTGSSGLKHDSPDEHPASARIQRVAQPSPAPRERSRSSGRPRSGSGRNAAAVNGAEALAAAAVVSLQTRRRPILARNSRTQRNKLWR